MIELGKKQKEWNNYWKIYFYPAIIKKKLLDKELSGKTLPGSHGINDIIDFVFLAQDYKDSDTIGQLLNAEVIKDLNGDGSLYFSRNFFGTEDKQFKYWAIFEDRSRYLISEKVIEKIIEP